jgi:hypothetical protein
MKMPRCLQVGRRSSIGLPPALSMSTPAAMLMLCLTPAPALAATNIVTTLADSGPGSLRQTINSSAPGDTITFAMTSGTITLTQALTIDKALNILGSGATNLAISGNHSTRIFLMPSSGAVLVSGLTFRDGQSSNGVNGTFISQGGGNYVATPGTLGEPGGAISTDGTLTLLDCVLQNNAAGLGGNGVGVEYGPVSSGANGGAGGAIYNKGTLTLSNCLVYQNTAGGGGASGSALDYGPPGAEGGSGGAIWSSGTLRLYNTVISDNRAGYGAGSSPGAGGATGGSGGGVWCGANLTASNCAFLRNSTGNGGYGGSEDGQAGSGGMAGSGGGIWCGGVLTLTDCIVNSNMCGVGGDGGGSAYNSGTGGGAGSGCGICSMNNAVLVRCTITGNYGKPGGVGGFNHYTIGGDGGPGSSGGGVYAGGSLTLTDCTVSRNASGNGGASAGPIAGWASLGGSGGAGGSGGGILGLGIVSLTNCTISDNICGNGGQGGQSVSGPGRGGGGGNGGGVYLPSGTGIVALVSCSIAGNHAGGPGPLAPFCSAGTNGIGGGVMSGSGGWLQCLNTIIALNSGDAPDVSGTFISLGHNLIGVTNGGSGFPAIGDQVGSSASPLDPKLAPLADNGGPTFTLALLPGSPAIDAGTATDVPLIDQRGVPRPQGAGVDIGAFEYQYIIPLISDLGFQGPDFWLRCCGLPGRTYTVQVSTNLLDWSDLNSFTSDTNGLFDYVDAAQTNHDKRFYRLKYTAP